MPSSGRTKWRFAVLYTAAWIPYALSYYVLFLGYGSSPLLETAYNIIPAMMAGLLVVLWCRVLRWRLHKRWWFYPAQLGSALAFSTLWSFGVILLGSVGNALVTHRFSFGLFGGYALQWQFFSGLMIYGNIVGIGYVLQANASLVMAERRREQAEALQRTAQLSTLRAQLNPHFLFNTLNSIAALAGPTQPATLQAIGELAAMLRYTLGHTGAYEEVSLREELSFTDQYLALEKLRLGDRLRIIRDVERKALGCVLPPLTIQPLVENALRHGIAPRANGGVLTLRAWFEREVLYLSIEDDGAGAELSQVEVSTGLGLSSVRRRLELIGGELAPFVTDTRPGNGFKVALTIPQHDVHEAFAMRPAPAEEGIECQTFER